jgi:exodeoxyribonuclease VII small subunit
MSAKTAGKSRSAKTTGAEGASSVDPHADLKFEEAMAALEEVVEKLEAGDVPLEESLSAFERGVGLVRTLHTRLDSVQEKIEQLTTGDRSRTQTQALEIDED